jgi:hypothetical protein
MDRAHWPQAALPVATAIFSMLLLSSGICGAAEVELPSALVCSFDEGVFTVFENGGFKTKQTDGGDHFVIAAIDATAGKAQIVGNAGAANVAMVVGEATATFIERTPMGNINTTTIYLKLEGTRFPAVESRHVGDAFGLMLSQNYGYCEARS